MPASDGALLSRQESKAKTCEPYTISSIDFGTFTPCLLTIHELAQMCILYGVCYAFFIQNFE